MMAPKCMWFLSLRRGGDDDSEILGGEQQNLANDDIKFPLAAANLELGIIPPRRVWVFLG